jgi:pSer/pThr/pTyr-binding forkhead associated (FHA) protein
MVRAVLIHRGQKILLEAGATLIGRGLHCGIRFNDTAVSREQARIVVEADRVRLENLSASNGTMLNGRRVSAPQMLAHGDAIRFGYHTVDVELIVGASRAVALDGPGSTEGLLLDEQAVAEEATSPGDHPALVQVPTEGARDAIDADDVESLAGLRTCTRCRGPLSDFADACVRCGAAVPERMQSVDTQRIKLEDIRARAAPRFATDVPLIYSSDSMTFDAAVRDLSEGGMFIATELLDAPGTECHIVVLPDGFPAATFSGVVVHVSQEPSESGRPAGLGVRFTASSPSGAQWLESVIKGPPGR